jgi:hypothetical protein
MWFPSDERWGCQDLLAYHWWRGAAGLRRAMAHDLTSTSFAWHYYNQKRRVVILRCVTAEVLEKQ